MSKWVQKVYTANDTLVAPAGVTKMILFGCGGGQGGVGGTNGYAGGGGTGGYGGICAPYTTAIVDVVPNTSYSITIGNGSSGTANAASPGTPSDGGDTSFGALAVFKGGTGSGPNTFGSVPMNIDVSLPFTTDYLTTSWRTTIAGGSGFGTANFGYAGALGTTATRGSQTTASTNGGAGGVGSNGFWGIGGASGNGGVNNTSAGTAGSNAPATSYGAGGGGGGGGAQSAAHRAGGAGGNGSNGILIVMWVE